MDPLAEPAAPAMQTNAVRVAEDPERRLGLPVLGTIPEAVTRKGGG
ncbi:MAG: hypothetical protein ACPLPT_09970 [Moorellales bacterium]